MECHRRRQRIYPLWWCFPTRSVRRNHFSRHHGNRDAKKANSSPSTPRTWTTSARRMTFSRATRVWSHRENCKDFFGSNRISNSIVPQGMALQVYPTATLTRSQGMVFLFRWPCYQIQVNTPVDVWSNHACQVALFFPSISTACSSRSVRSCPASELLAQVGPTRSSPAYRKCTPRQREPTGCVLSKVGQSNVCLGGLAVTGLWARNAP